MLVRRGAAIEAVSTPACDQTAGAGLVGSCPGKVGRGGAVGPVWRELGLSAAVVGSGQDHRGMHSRAVLELEQHPCRGTLDHGQLSLRYRAVTYNTIEPQVAALLRWLAWTSEPVQAHGRQ